MKYFYTNDGRQVGPISFDELRELATKAELKRQHKVWCPGMKEWQLASSIELLFDDLPPDLDHQIPQPTSSEKATPVATPTPELPALPAATPGQGSSDTGTAAKKGGSQLSREVGSLTWILIGIVAVVVGTILLEPVHGKTIHVWVPLSLAWLCAWILRKVWIKPHDRQPTRTIPQQEQTVTHPATLEQAGNPSSQAFGASPQQSPASTTRFQLSREERFLIGLIGGALILFAGMLANKWRQAPAESAQQQVSGPSPEAIRNDRINAEREKRFNADVEEAARQLKATTSYNDSAIATLAPKIVEKNRHDHVTIQYGRGSGPSNEEIDEMVYASRRVVDPLR